MTDDHIIQTPLPPGSDVAMDGIPSAMVPAATTSGDAIAERVGGESAVPDAGGEAGVGHDDLGAGLAPAAVRRADHSCS
jgi:hypothetical protein